MKRKIKRKIRRFWREWGLSKEEAVDFLAAIALIVGITQLPLLADIIAIAFF